MTTWVLFIWYFSGAPIAAWNYDVAADCERAAAAYRRSACVQVVVPAPKARQAK